MSEVKGKVVKILPTESGTTKQGKDWSNKQFVVETEGQYPKKVCLTASGKSLEYAEKLQVNDEVTVMYNPESSEYNEKWYTKLNAYSIKSEKKTPLTTEQKQAINKAVDKFNLETEDGSDLPF